MARTNTQGRRKPVATYPTAMRAAFTEALFNHPSGPLAGRVERRLGRNIGWRRHYKFWRVQRPKKGGNRGSN